jgi:hypothetical protein
MIILILFTIIMLLPLQDYASMLDRQWVRDNIITFYFEYLVRTGFPAIAKNVGMLDVSTAFLLKQLGAPFPDMKHR